MGRRTTRAVCLALTVALSAAGCSDGKTDQQRPAQTEATTQVATADASTRLDVGDGYSVQLAKSAVAPGTDIEAVTETVSGFTESDGVSIESDALRVTLDPAVRQLASPATVTFPVSDDLGATVTPAVLWQNDTGDLELVASEYDRGQRTVTATVPHFSWGVLIGISTSGIARQLWTQHSQWLGRSRVQSPRCADERAASEAGVSVTSDGGDSVKWCFGIERGQQVLKIANNRSTFASVAFPSTWRVVGSDGPTLSTNTLARALGQGSAPRTQSQEARIVDAGDTLTLAVAPQGGRARVQLSTAAWAVTGIVFGLDVASQTIKKVSPGTAAAGRGLTREKLLEIIGDPGSKSAVLDALRECTRGVSNLTETNSAATAAAAQDILKFAIGCGTSVAKAHLSEGLSVVAAVGVNLAFTAVELVKDAVKVLTSGVRELWDQIAALGGRSDPYYDIDIRQRIRILDVNGQTQVGFASPSGNISCTLDSAAYDDEPQARCEIDEYNFPSGPRPRGCPTSWGNTFVLTDVAQDRVCAGDTIALQAALDPGFPSASTQWFASARQDGAASVATLDNGAGTRVAALNYGYGLRLGDHTCAMLETGVICENTRTGHGFGIARDDFSLK